MKILERIKTCSSEFIFSVKQRKKRKANNWRNIRKIQFPRKKKDRYLSKKKRKGKIDVSKILEGSKL